jgi:beta-lactamase class A
MPTLRRSCTFCFVTLDPQDPLEERRGFVSCRQCGALYHCVCWQRQPHCSASGCTSTNAEQVDISSPPLLEAIPIRREVFYPTKIVYRLGSRAYTLGQLLLFSSLGVVLIAAIITTTTMIADKGSPWATIVSVAPTDNTPTMTPGLIAAEETASAQLSADVSTTDTPTSLLISELPAPTTRPAPTTTPSPRVPTPTEVPTLTPEKAFPADALRAALTPAGGKFGVVIYDQASGRVVYAQNENEVFPAASLIKLPIALTAYDLARRGALNLDEQLTMGVEDVTEGNGSMQNAPVGSTYTIRELCRRMMAESDNTAGNMMLKRIGFEEVNATAEWLGTRQTSAARRFLDFAAAAQGRDNVTTPADMVLLLQKLVSGAINDSADRKDLLAALTQNIDRAKIPAGLPIDVEVAHKTGVLTGVEHDAGIVYLSNRTYIVVFMSRDLPDNNSGISAIARASAVVFEWFAEP